MCIWSTDETSSFVRVRVEPVHALMVSNANDKQCQCPALQYDFLTIAPGMRCTRLAAEAPLFALAVMNMLPPTTRKSALHRRTPQSLPQECLDSFPLGVRRS